MVWWVVKGIMKEEIKEALRKWTVGTYNVGANAEQYCEEDAKRIEEEISSNGVTTIPKYDGKDRENALIKDLQNKGSAASIVERACSGQYRTAQKGVGELAFFLMIENSIRVSPGDVGYIDDDGKKKQIELKNPQLNACVPTSGKFTDLYNNFHDVISLFRFLCERLMCISPLHPLIPVLEPYLKVKIGEVRAGSKTESPNIDTNVPSWIDINNTLKAIFDNNKDLEDDLECKIYVKK